MKCDLCGNKIDSDNCVIYAEVDNSRLCQACFKAVTTEAAEETAPVETVVVSNGANVPEQSANVPENEYRCHSCGGICDSSRTFCTKCGNELNSPSSQEPCPDNEEHNDELSTTNAPEQTASLLSKTIIISVVLLLFLFQVRTFSFGRILVVIFVCIIAILSFSNQPTKSQYQNGQHQVDERPPTSVWSALGKVVLLIVGFAILVLLSLFMICSLKFRW